MDLTLTQDSHQLLGSTLVIISTLLACYLLILRVREYWEEKPDPKLTYATIKQLNSLITQLKYHETQTRKQTQALRLETKNDLQLRDHRHHDALEGLRELIARNAQSIAALTAKAHITQERIAQLTTQVDKSLRSKSAVN